MFTPHDLHNKKFQVYIPELFNNKIPEYFKRPVTYRPPMINGMPATPDEYMEKDPTYMQDEAFIPALIYDPFENNITISFKSVVEIYDGYQDGINILFKNPKNMLDMIEIIRVYITATEGIARFNPTAQAWNTKLANFSSTLDITYKEYLRKLVERLPHKRPPGYGLLTPKQLLSLFKG